MNDQEFMDKLKNILNNIQSTESRTRKRVELVTELIEYVVSCEDFFNLNKSNHHQKLKFTIINKINEFLDDQLLTETDKRKFRFYKRQLMK